MKVHELRQMLAELPDDADVTIELSANRTEASISELEVGWPVGAVSQVPPGTAVAVCLYEPEPSGEVYFDDQVRLRIPDELVDLCADYKLKPEQLLHGFIADLCGIQNLAANPRPDELCSNGSDERDMAWAWFNRAGYTWRNSGEAA